MTVKTISLKIMVNSLLFFIFSFTITSVYSIGDSAKDKIRYLQEEEIPESHSYSKFINCSGEKLINCSIHNMECGANRENCTCRQGYYFDEDRKKFPDKKFCEIKEKKQIVAFLLELFVGFGAGHFYRHHYLMASLKLVAFCIGIISIYLFPLIAKGVSERCDNDFMVILVSIFFYLYALGLAFWYIWDVIYFGKNKYPDYSNGDECIKMKPW